MTLSMMVILAILLAVEFELPISHAIGRLWRRICDLGDLLTDVKASFPRVAIGIGLILQTL